MTTSPESSLSHYLTMINSFPRLSRTQEISLWREWKQKGSKIAYENLINANLRHVASIAFKYRRYSIPFSDLISEGNYGLVHAAQKFDPDRGLRFLTYAVYWVRAYILNYVIHSWSLVGAGAGPFRSRLFFKLRRERARVCALVGDGSAATEMLAKRLNMPVERVAEFEQRLSQRDFSIDSELDSGQTLSIVDNLVQPRNNQEELYVELETNAFIRDIVQRAIATLDCRERFVVEASVMNDSDKNLSLAEIGRVLGISRERSRQLGVRAQKKLRKYISQKVVEQESCVKFSDYCTWNISFEANLSTSERAQSNEQ